MKSLDGIKWAYSEVRYMPAGGKAINLGELAIAIALKTGALEQGLNEVKKQLNKSSQEIKKTSADYDKLAIVAGVAFWKISGAIRSGITAFNEFNNSMVGLKSIVQGTGNDFGKAQRFIDEFTKDGLVPAANAAAGLKNLLSHGFGMDQAAEVMNRFKDSAAFARQGSLSMGQAIQGATEGLKNSMSMMVDNAGVTENLSIMWEKYAATIGKAVGELTDAEKVQAEYVGVMRATQFQVGDAAKYAKEFAGSQAKAAAETTKLQQSLGGGMVPILNSILSLITPLIQGITFLVKLNPELAGTLLLLVAGFTGLVTVLISIRAAVALLGPALAALKVELMAIATNPIVLALTALAAVIGIVVTQIQKAKRAQEEYTAAVERFNKIKSEGITRAEVPQLKEEAAQLEKLIQQYDQLTARYETLKNSASEIAAPLSYLKDAERETGISAEKLTEGFRKLGLQIDIFKGNTTDAKQRVDDLKNAIREAEKVTASEYNEQAKSIAQRRASVIEVQNLVKAYKSAEKGSTEWQQAQKALSDIFPQFSSNSGIAIEAIEKVTTAQDLAVKAEWTMLQAKIRMSRMDLETTLATQQAKVDSYRAIIDLSSADAGITGAMLGKLQDATDKLTGIKADIAAMKDMEQIDIDKILGGKPVNFDFDGKTYTNKALDDALKILNHRKAMNQLSLEDEQKTLESIMKKYAKTADEKMDIEERLFGVKQAIRERDKTAAEKAMADELKLVEKQGNELRKKTDETLNKLDTQKLFGDVDAQAEIKAYNRIIADHKAYLNKIIVDKKLAEDEKERIIEQETNFIQEQERKVFDIRKSYIEKAINQYIAAKKKQFDTEESMEEKRLNDKLKALDKEYADRERALDASRRNNELTNLYEEEKRFQNAATKEGQDRLREIRERIADLQMEGQQDAMDAEKEARRAAIEQELDDNKAKYNRMREDLERSQAEMLAASSKMAAKTTEELSKQNNTIAGTLLDIMKTFDKNSQDLVSQGMEKLRTMLAEYKKLMAEFNLNPATAFGASYGSSSTSGAKLQTAGNISVTVNDYGTKHINSKDEAIDYTGELFNAAKNAVRGAGGRI